MLEAKHQQQLRDLEEAMKSTWESKAKQSEEHEKERVRLEREQLEVQRKIAQQREDNWRLLENKGDLELSIGHLRDLLRAAQPEGGTDLLGTWSAELREILKLEADLAEQYTVIDVYRSSVARDGEALAKERPVQRKNTGTDNAISMVDKIAVGQWRQLRDKFQAIYVETSKWIEIQSRLVCCIETFTSSIASAQAQWLQSQAEYVLY